MGSEQPKWEKTSSEPPKSLLPIMIGVFVMFLFLVIYFSGESEAPKLSPKEDAKLQKRLKEIDEAEQYALIAIKSGWYPCSHSGRTTFYLLTGEVWKYGTTTKGQFGRYSIKYLSTINVSYFVQFRGTIAECLKEEQLKLFYYPYLLENLARLPEERLTRPPYNSKMQ